MKSGLWIAGLASIVVSIACASSAGSIQLTSTPTTQSTAPQSAEPTARSTAIEYSNELLSFAESHTRTLDSVVTTIELLSSQSEARTTLGDASLTNLNRLDPNQMDSAELVRQLFGLQELTADEQAILAGDLSSLENMLTNLKRDQVTLIRLVQTPEGSMESRFYELALVAIHQETAMILELIRFYTSPNLKRKGPEFEKFPNVLANAKSELDSAVDRWSTARSLLGLPVDLPGIIGSTATITPASTIALTPIIDPRIDQIIRQLGDLEDTLDRLERSVKATATATPTITPTPTLVPTATNTPVPTLTPTLTPTITPFPTPSGNIIAEFAGTGTTITPSFTVGSSPWELQWNTIDWRNGNALYFDLIDVQTGQAIRRLLDARDGEGKWPIFETTGAFRVQISPTMYGLEWEIKILD